MNNKETGSFKFSEADFNKFYRYALSLTRNEDLAYDLLQNCLEKFMLKDGHTKDYPNSYLYTIIRNRFIDDMRSKNRWNLVSIDGNGAGEPSKINIIDFEALNEDSISSTEQAKRILAQVKPEERELIYLWAVEGHTVHSISEKFDIPKGTILSRLHRIKKKLKVFMLNERKELQEKA